MDPRRQETMTAASTTPTFTAETPAPAAKRGTTTDGVKAGQLFEELTQLDAEELAELRDSIDRVEAPYASHGFFTKPGRLDDAKPEQRRQGIDAGLAWGAVAQLCAVYSDHGVSEGMAEGMGKHADNGDLGGAPLSPGEKFRLAQMDAVEWLQSLQPGSVDLVITDPAYESLEKHRAKGTTTRLKVSDGSSNAWFKIFPNGRFPELFAATYRALARNSHFYMMCDQETGFFAKPLAEAAGFKFWKAIVWDKVQIGMGYHYRARHEWVMFFEKGERRLRDLGIADVLSIPRVRNGYPTEKPVKLSELLIGQSSEPGEIVADPFMGSGSVGVAALQQCRRFLGSDISDDAHLVAEPRLEEAAK